MTDAQSPIEAMCARMPELKGATIVDFVGLDGWMQRTFRLPIGRYVNVDSKNKKPFELPVEALRAINANGSVIFDQLVLADTHMTDVRLKLQTPEGNP